MSTVVVEPDFLVYTVGSGESLELGTSATEVSVAVGVVAVGSGSPFVAVWEGSESTEDEGIVMPCSRQRMLVLREV